MAETCTSYTFTLRRLGSRDEIVLKSVIRLLQSKTRHTWLHRDDGNADLVLLGDQPDKSQAFIACAPGQQAVINVNSAGRRESNALAWPIRTDEFLSHLDKAGEQLARRNEAVAHLPIASADQRPAHFSRSGPLLMQRVSLLRWPDTALLKRDPRFTKLATILTGQPINLAALAARSTYPLNVCQGFVDLLAAAGLLRVVEPVALTENAAAQAGTAMPATRTPQTGSTSRLPAQAPRGLISRIRQRLEMIIGSPADRQAKR